MTMPAMTPGPVPQGTRSQRWLARLSFVLAGLAIVSLVVVAGLKSLAMLALGLAAAVVSPASAYFFLSRRGLWRWLSLTVFIVAPIAVILAYAFRDLLWIAVLSAAVWLLASMTARVALAGNQADWCMPERPAQPPARHPYLIMNPKSGGGKVEKFDLKRKAEDPGAEVFLIDGPEPVDVAKVARQAVDRCATVRASPRRNRPRTGPGCGTSRASRKQLRLRPMTGMGAIPGPPCLDSGTPRPGHRIDRR